MRIDHGRRDVRVPKELLNRPNVATTLKKVRRKGMSKGVDTDPGGQAKLPNGRFDGLLERGFMKMMAMHLAGSRIHGMLGGRKEKLPGQFNGRVGIFIGNGVGEPG